MAPASLRVSEPSCKKCKAMPYLLHQISTVMDVRMWHVYGLVAWWGCYGGATQKVSVEHEQASIAQYARFEALAPLFEKDNDTLYVINFWATWCKPCVAEIPYFEQLVADFADRPVRVVLVSLDFPDQVETKLIPFVRQRRLRAEVAVLLDERFNEWIPRVDTSWGGVIPATHLHRGEAKVFLPRAFRSYGELQDLVNRLLAN